MTHSARHQQSRPPTALEPGGSYPPPQQYQQPPQSAAQQQWAPQPQAPPVIPLSARFEFDGGAATYWGTALLSFIVTVFSLGLLAPWGICMRYRWRTKHTIIDGYRLVFTGHAVPLFGMWLKWWFFTIITFGIYGFWVFPRLQRWITRHQQFDMSAPRTL